MFLTHTQHALYALLKLPLAPQPSLAACLVTSETNYACETLVREEWEWSGNRRVVALERRLPLQTGIMPCSFCCTEFERILEEMSEARRKGIEGSDVQKQT